MRTRFGSAVAASLAMLTATLPAAAESPSPSREMSVVLEVGNWQPQSLNDELRMSSFGECGATPRLAAGLSFPLGKDLGFRVVGGFWALRDPDEDKDVVRPLSFHQVSADFKYWLVPDFRLSAYVLYGGTVYWGLEDETRPFGSRLSKAKPSWGANLGAGFDLALSHNIGTGMVFQYRLIRLREAVGGLADFSGPDIAVALYLFL
jgi:hypothetical protein